MMRARVAALHEWIARLGGTLRRGRSDKDLEEELRVHQEFAIEEARRRGGAPEAATRRARIAGGGIVQAMESVRDQRGLPWLDALARDVRHGCRVLRRSPLFAAFAAVSLALGIGANTAVFSFADGLLLRPLPVPQARELVTVGSPDAFSGNLGLSYREYVDLKDRAKSFDRLVPYAIHTAAFAAERGGQASPRIGMLVDAHLFDALDVKPQLGRGFRPEENQVPGRDAVLILGNDFWRQQFGADASILGRTVQVGGIAFTVVGVAPEGFTGLDQYIRFEFYAPLMMWPRLMGDQGTQPLEARDHRALTVKGWLAPAMTMAHARAEASAIARDLERAHPETNRDRTLTVRTEIESRIAQAPPVALLLAMLATLSGAVLLVACANVAGLLASRTPVRAREIALRMAIGAGRFRVIRQLIVESVLLALVGGLFALAVGYAGVTLFRRIQIPTDLPISPVFELDVRALLVSIVIALLSAVLFGLGPAIQASRAELNVMVKASEAVAPDGRRRWGRSVLVAGQVAISVVLLVVATLIYQGFAQRLRSGPGFRTDHVLLMRFDPDLLHYGDAQSRQFFQQLVERAAVTPGVRSAALASAVPMEGVPPRITIVPEGFQFPVGTSSATMPSAAVDARYFDTLAVPILKGRPFRASDSAGSPLVAIVNEEVSRLYWAGGDPIGKRFRLNDASGPWVEIVGLAKTSKYNFITEQPRPFVYLCYLQHPPRPMTLFVESEGDPSSLAGPMREVVRRLDPNQPVYSVRTLEEFYRMRAVAVLNVLSSLIGSMGLMALVLAVVGVYALVAYAAGRRTREIGIRMAIGADRTDVVRMILRQGVVLTVIGLGVGLVSGLAAQSALRTVFTVGLRFDRRIDLAGFLLVAATVSLTTLLAAYLPARRASRVNPTDALRYE